MPRFRDEALRGWSLGLELRRHAVWEGHGRGGEEGLARLWVHWKVVRRYFLYIHTALERWAVTHHRLLPRGAKGGWETAAYPP